LQPAGLYLFSDFENLVDSMKDLSENDLKVAFGGKKPRAKRASRAVV